MTKIKTFEAYRHELKAPKWVTIPRDKGVSYGKHMETLLEPTGWSLEKWRDELGKREAEVFKRYPPK